MTTELLTHNALRTAAGALIYSRGHSIRSSATGLRISDSSATCSVLGTDLYSVTLDWASGSVSGTCTCPYFQGGKFCKHMVACGVAVIAEQNTDDDAVFSPIQQLSSAQPTAAENGKTNHDRDLRQIVDVLDEDTVRALLTTAAEHDPALERLLRSHTAEPGDLGNELLQVTKAGLRVYGFIDYYASSDVADQAGQVLDELELQLSTGAADAAAPALLHAVKRLRRIVENADDSNGVIGDQCQRALDLYARACREGSPDTVRLAKWLVNFRAESPGWPEVRLQDFIDALDERGLSSYRKAVQKAVQDSSRDIAYSSDLDRMRLELADHDGEVDTAVAILAEGEPPEYGAIVRRLFGADRPGEAMRWVDRAVDAGKVADRHNDYWLSAGEVAELYRSDGRDEDGLRLLQDHFRRSPNRRTYTLLVTFAENLDRRDEVHQWAIDAAWETARSGRHYGNPVIDIALHAGDLELAWSAADELGASSSWHQLAVHSAERYPERAYELFRTDVEKHLPHTNTRLYPMVAEELATMRSLARAAHIEDQFTAYLASIKTKYGNRPRMMKDLAYYDL